MKNSKTVSFLTLIILSSFLNFAPAEARTNKPAENFPIHHRSISSGPSDLDWGLGFSTVQTTLPGSPAAITAILNLDAVNMLQGFFSLPTTSPFNIGALFLYKRTVVRSRGAGFHLGGGLGFADVNIGAGGAFAMNLDAIAGFHFEMPGIPNIMVHLDGGPSLSLTNTNPTTTSSFQIAGLSAAMGASIIYMF